MKALGANVGLLGDLTNDRESTRALGDEATFISRPLSLIPDPHPTPQ